MADHLADLLADHPPLSQILPIRYFLPMTLHVTNLSCRRSDRQVLSGLTFSVEPGQALQVQGPNGVGKSTLLRVLAGLTVATSGTVTLGAASLTNADDWSAQVAYLGHLDAVKPQLTFAQNLRFWAQLNGEGNIPQALSALNLTHLADQPALIASAGQKKRLALARLTLTNRSLWLLDEPLSSLDQDSQFSFEKLLKSHLATGGIAVIATHQPVNLPHTTLQLAAVA